METSPRKEAGMIIMPKGHYKDKSKTSAFLRYGNTKLLNLPHAEAVAEEVIKDDCYRIDHIVEGSIVIDIGAFYGEFAIAAFWRGHKVWAFEPDSDNFSVLNQNFVLNGCPIDIRCFNYGVSNKIENPTFIQQDDHPAGNRVKKPNEGGILKCFPTIECVPMSNIVSQVRARHGKEALIFVKMDCEGMETEIFKDSTWIKEINQISMEWHNHDGDLYRDILMSHGFNVTLEGGGPPPRPAYDKSIGGGLLHAIKKEQQNAKRTPKGKNNAGRKGRKKDARQTKRVSNNSRNSKGNR